MAITRLNPQYSTSVVTITPIGSYTIVSSNSFKYRNFASIYFRLGNCASITAKQWTSVATMNVVPNSTLETGGTCYSANGFDSCEIKFYNNNGVGTIQIWPYTTGYREMYFNGVLLIQ